MVPSHGVCELIIVCGNQNHCSFWSILWNPEKMYYTIIFSEENFILQAYLGYNSLFKILDICMYNLGSVSSNLIQACIIVKIHLFDKQPKSPPQISSNCFHYSWQKSQHSLIRQAKSSTAIFVAKPLSHECIQHVWQIGDHLLLMICSGQLSPDSFDDFRWCGWFHENYVWLLLALAVHLY